MKVSVIISTYNSEEWLKKVLLGYSVQTEQDFELVIADDGSTPLTKEVLVNMQPLFKHPIIHVWHEDLGFQKTIISTLIKEIKNAQYLISYENCIKTRRFVNKIF